MCCIEIRRKALLASNKSDRKCDKELVRKLFYRNLERRLIQAFLCEDCFNNHKNHSHLLLCMSVIK